MKNYHSTIYCRSRNLGGAVIRIFDGMRQWSHQAGILADGEYAIEARAVGGVQITPLADIIRRSSEFVIVTRTVPDKSAGDAWARSTLGSKYDWGGVIGKPFNRAWQHEGRWYCSEHDTAWLVRCGLQVFRDGTRGISPNDSYMVVTQ